MSLAVKENVGRSGDLERVISNLTAGVYSFGSLSGAVLHELDKLARSLGDNCRSLETGCGRSTIMFSNLARRHLCFCFDDRNAQLPAGRDDNFGTVSFVQANPHFNKDCVTFVFGPTQKTVPNYDFRDVSLDFVFLDGPHAFPFAELEYYFVYPYIRKGGILGIDDINIPTLANFFRFLRDDAMWRLISVVENTAFFERTEAPTFDPIAGIGGHNWQRYNTLHFPAHPILSRNIYLKYIQPMGRYLPASAKNRLKKILSR